MYLFTFVIKIYLTEIDIHIYDVLIFLIRFFDTLVVTICNYCRMTNLICVNDSLEIVLGTNIRGGGM